MKFLLLFISWPIIGIIFSYLTWKIEKLHVKKFNDQCLWFRTEKFVEKSNMRILASDFTAYNLFIGVVLGYTCFIGFMFTVLIFLIKILNGLKIENRD